MISRCWQENTAVMPPTNKYSKKSKNRKEEQRKVESEAESTEIKMLQKNLTIKKI